MSFCLLGEQPSHALFARIFCVLSGSRLNFSNPPSSEFSGLLRNTAFSGFCISEAYQKEILPHIDCLTPEAQRTGTVDAVIRKPDGALHGHNTKYLGIKKLAEKSGITFIGKKVLIIGDTHNLDVLFSVLKDLGASTVTLLSAQDDLSAYTYSTVIVNNTSITDEEIIDLNMFPELNGVLDLSCTPYRTKLLMDAEKLGIRHMGGLWAVVGQAWAASAFLTGNVLPESTMDSVYRTILRDRLNIVLVGMPGCGKTTIGGLLASRMGRPFADTDIMITSKAGMTVEDFFFKSGEIEFRDSETQMLNLLKSKEGHVIATGGGCITQIRNYPLLHQNGRIIWLLRDLEKLPTNGRPLSQANTLSALYSHRKPMYEAFADISIDNNGTPEETVTKILSFWESSF